MQCPIYGEKHEMHFDYATADKTVYYCLCGESLIEYEDAGTGA